MPQYLTAAQMSEITNTLNLLIIAVLGGAVTMVGVLVAAGKWYLPKRLEQQTAERETRLEAFKIELENKNAAERVDIERDRMLPQLIENNQQLVNAVLKMGNAFNDTTIRRIEQDATNNNTLLAHSKAVVSVTERMEEVVQTLDTAVINLQNVQTATTQSRDFSEMAANAARETLLLVKRQLTNVIEEVKNDTGPLPPLKDIVKDTPAEPVAGEGSAAA